MTEQERPRTEAGRRLYRDTREGMTILQDAMRSRILAIEAEGRQQAVREIRRGLWFLNPTQQAKAETVYAAVAGLNASESPPTLTRCPHCDGGGCSVCFGTGQTEGDASESGPTCKRCGHGEGCSTRCCMNTAEPCDFGDASESGPDPRGQR